ARLNLARVLAELGDLLGAEDRAARARASARTCGARWIEAHAELAIADAARRRGELDLAREALARARATAEAIKNVPLSAEVELGCAEVELDGCELAWAEGALDAFAGFPLVVASVPLVTCARILRARLFVERARGVAEIDRVFLFEQASQAATIA